MADMVQIWQRVTMGHGYVMVKWLNSQQMWIGQRSRRTDKQCVAKNGMLQRRHLSTWGPHRTSFAYGWK